MKEMHTTPTYRVEIRQLKAPSDKDRNWGVLPTEYVETWLLNEDAKEQMLRGLVKILEASGEDYWFDFTASHGGEIIIVSSGPSIVNRITEKIEIMPAEPETDENWYAAPTRQEYKLHGV